MTDTALDHVPAALTDLAEERLAAQNWPALLGLVGNERRPAFLLDLWRDGHVADEHLADGLLLDVWECGPHYRHLDCIGVDWWLAMFDAAGYVSDNGSPPPTTSVTAWRGAPTPTGRLGMSWSTDRAKAEWFRARWTAAGVASSLWVVTVEPTDILGVTNGRDEHEVILDPRRISPTLVSTDA